MLILMSPNKILCIKWFLTFTFVWSYLPCMKQVNMLKKEETKITNLIQFPTHLDLTIVVTNILFVPMSYCNFHCLHHHAYCHNLYFIVIHISPLLLSLFTTIFSSLFGAIQNVANVGYVSVQEFNQINFSNNVPCSRHLGLQCPILKYV